MKIWLYWWRVYPTSGHPYIKTTYSTRPLSAKTLQAYDRFNEWRVGKLHRKRVNVEKE